MCHARVGRTAASMKATHKCTGSTPMNKGVGISQMCPFATSVCRSEWCPGVGCLEEVMRTGGRGMKLIAGVREGRGGCQNQLRPPGHGLLHSDVLLPLWHVFPHGLWRGFVGARVASNGRRVRWLTPLFYEKRKPKQERHEPAAPPATHPGQRAAREQPLSCRKRCMEGVGGVNVGDAKKGGGGQADADEVVEGKHHWRAHQIPCPSHLTQTTIHKAHNPQACVKINTPLPRFV